MNATSTKHTPGPWEAYIDCPSGSLDYEWRIGRLGDTDDIAPIAMLGEEDGGGLNEANARLIAAAPELLSALKGLLNALNQDDDGDYFICAEAETDIEEARVAIAKAEGGAA